MMKWLMSMMALHTYNILVFRGEQ